MGKTPSSQHKFSISCFYSKVCIVILAWNLASNSYYSRVVMDIFHFLHFCWIYSIRKSYPFYHSNYSYISWTHGYLYYPMGYNLMLSLFILSFIFSRLVIAALSHSRLCLAICPYLFMSTYLLLKPQYAPVEFCVFPSLDLGNTSPWIFWIHFRSRTFLRFFGFFYGYSHVCGERHDSHII